jgi:precorrin-6B methylase 2
MASDQESILQKMRGLIFGFSITRSIAVAAELGIADKLAIRPHTAAELATQCGVLERPLYRVLRALAGEGVFAEDEGRFALTATAELLRSDHPLSLRDWALYMADLVYRTQLEMMDSVKTGEPSFRKVFGLPLFDYHSAHPESAGAVFRAMSSISAARIAGVVKTYDFSVMSTLVDLGAASGAMAAAIAQRYPELRCICFDLPTAEAGTRQTFRESGVADRCDFVGGSFFDDVPAGADAYILSAVLHDWDDERCHQILRNCRRRIPDTGRLLIVDIVMSDQKNVHDTYRNFLDVCTLTQVGGMERSESEFRTLLAAAGFVLNRIIRIDAPQWIVEALPA